MNDKSYSNNKDVYKEKDNTNKNLPQLFNYFIKDKSLGLCLISRNRIKWYNNVLKIPITKEEKDSKLNSIYKQNYKLSNLSFYKAHNKYENEIINDDSVLFIELIKDSSDFENLVKIIKDNKVKVIIIKEFHVEESELEGFIVENNIPVYTITNNAYTKFIDFFIEGKGGI